MTLYIGDKPVGLMKVVEKKVAKTKYGVSIDNLLGDVDENGRYIVPSKRFVADFKGVKTFIGTEYLFYGNPGIEGLIANDATLVGLKACLSLCRYAKNLTFVEFNSLETISSSSSQAFEYAFNNCPQVVPSFSKLKSVSGEKAFGNFLSRLVDADKMFPSLEELSGYGPFDNFMAFKASNPIVFSKAKKIIGQTSQYNATFGSVYMRNLIWHFPRATEVTNYILNISSSYPGELHFAAANQAALEACAGYDKKWGFAGATIYFDLMLTIVVNGVEYSRELTIDGYTSWKDESDNIVYTEASAEPAVGTAAYSDQGTTQVGTVSEVA